MIKIIFSLLWLFTCYVFVLLLFGPVTYLFYQSITALHSFLIFTLFPFAFLLGLFSVCVLMRFFYLVVPNYGVGTFHLFNDKDSILWAVNNAPAVILLKWLQGLLFLNDELRFLLLKSLGCHVHYSSWVSSNVHLSDLRHIYIGRNTLIAEKCFLSPSIQTKRNKLRVAPIIIGDDVMVGYKCEIGPGCRIGEKSMLQTHVTLTINNQIGNHCVIGAGTVIYPNVKIGNNVKIGTACVIHSGVNIPDNTIIKTGITISSSKECNE